MSGTDATTVREALAHRQENGSVQIGLEPADCAAGCPGCAAEAALARLVADRDEALALLTEAYPGDYPTNTWRMRVEKLGAWPPDTTSQRVRDQLLTGAAEAYLGAERPEPDERKWEPR